MTIPRRGRSTEEATRLVHTLQRVKEVGKKSLIKSTDHLVNLEVNNGESFSNDASRSALVEEVEGEGAEEIHTHGNAEAGSSKLTLTSWKTQEFAYRKASKIGYDDDDELPTLARGLFTCSEAEDKHRIVVRGYDKFFNEGEMLWTKVSEE